MISADIWALRIVLCQILNDIVEEKKISDIYICTSFLLLKMNTVKGLKKIVISMEIGEELSDGC